MQNVAAYAGVSIATVSKVMQGDPTVRPENVTAVQNAIEALGYRINPLASELRRGRRQVIGVVVPSFDGVLGQLLEAIERRAEEKGYTLSVVCSRGSEKREGELIVRLQDWRVAAIILVPVQEGSTVPGLLDDGVAPIICVGRHAASQAVDVVIPDAAVLARRLLKECERSGRRRVLVATAPKHAPGGKARGGEALGGEVLEAALRAAASRWPDLDVRFLAGDESAGEGMRRQLAGQEAPTALIALSGAALLSALRALGDGTPARAADFQVVALWVAEWLDEWLDGVDPGVRTIRYPADDLSHAVLDQIEARLGGAQPRDASAVRSVAWE